MGGTGTGDGLPDPAVTGIPPAADGDAAPAAERYPALDGLYQAHYRALVRLAALLTTDTVLAEEIAAASVAALISSAARSGAPERILFRLRQQVVLRSRRLARGGAASAVRSDSPVMRVLGSLPRGQREAVVLRHYLGLGDEEAAAIMGTSQRAVRRLAIITEAAYQSLRADCPGV
jgi:DNA-directed RNA polymerase specialized sigma24 family protein